MLRLFNFLSPLAIVLWVGGLWAIGFVAAPVAFNVLADRVLAGQVAGQMFTVMAWIGMGSAGVLLIWTFAARGWRAFQTAAFWIVFFMLLLTLLGYFGIQPILATIKAEGAIRDVAEELTRSRFAVWHGIASVIYVIECVLGFWLVFAQRKI